MELPFTVLLLVSLTVCTVTGKRDSKNKDRASRHNRDDGTCELEVSCKGTAIVGDAVSAPVKLPIRGPRGPAGLPGDKGDRGEDGIPGSPGMPGKSALTIRKIAFFAGLTDNMGPVKKHEDIKLDKVITNVGGGYDPKTGHFTAPINATYQFNINISAQGRQKAAVMIIKNGAMIATVWAESIPYWGSASNVVVLSLKQGDQVWLMLINRASYLHGYMYTTFSGFMIFEQ